MSLCVRCKINPMEDFGDGEPGPQCVECNDRDIRRNNNWEEWRHFHPGEPIPKLELDK